MADYKPWLFTPYNEDDEPITTGVYYYVLTTGTATLGTIYSDQAATAKTNPVSTTVFSADGGYIKFFTANSVTAVDLIVFTNDGGVAYKHNMANRSQKVRVNTDMTCSPRIYPVPFNGLSSNYNTSNDTGFSVPIGGQVVDAKLWVDASPGSGTINVGLATTESGGDVNGYLAATSIATSGTVQPWIVELGSGSGVFSTANNLLWNWASGCTLGDLIVTKITGTASCVGLTVLDPTLIESGAAQSVVVNWSVDSDVNGIVFLKTDLLPMPRGV